MAGWVRGSFWIPIAVLPLMAAACGGASSHSGEQGPHGGAGGSSAGSASGGTAGDTAGSSGQGGGGKGGSSGASSGSGGSGGSTIPGASSVSLDGSPIYTRVQRLTVPQWKNAVADILRLEAPGDLGDGFQQPVAGVTDFTNNERVLFVDLRGALDFESGSEAAAALATGSAGALSRLYSGTDPSGFVSTLGRRAFRRPITAEEQAKYEGVFALGEQLYGPGFANGAALVIRAMLVSPHFLYRTELGPAGEPLDGYEAASKLSFWLLGTTPSDALLDAAGAGELDSADGIEQRAREMLEQPGAAEVMRDFHGQAYRLSRYATVVKPDVAGFDEAAQELAQASTLFFDRVFEAGEGLREILTSSRAFVGPALAPFYGVDPPASIEERNLDSSRIGFFMQLPFLMAFSSNSGDPGTIGRGIALDQEVLCNSLPPPSDPTVPPLPAPSPGQTNRERIEELTAGCGDCHTLFIDPLGFAFEAFDGLGRERELDNGSPVDTAASYPFADGVRDFAGAKELMQIMADTTQAHTCYAKKVTGYALQRDLVEEDRPLLEGLSVVSREESLKETVVSLVRDPAFRLRAEGTP